MPVKDPATPSEQLAIIRGKLVEYYCSAVFILKNPKKAASLFALFLGRLFSKKRYIFNLATPTHTNIGDQMIVAGMKKWCETYCPDYAYKEYDDGIYKNWSYFFLLKAVIRKKDLLFLRGGGSVGDWYIGYEYFIRHVLKSYPKNKIVMFPQSVRFSPTPLGEEEKKLTVSAYDSHPDFTLYTRDETSYSLAKEMFGRAKVRLCPDIAMYLFQRYPLESVERKGLFLCLRTDKNETYYRNGERLEMTEHLKSVYQVTVGDTSAGHGISAETRDFEIRKLLSHFSKSRAAVTDRFHGVISAVITGTPCVVLRSADHKIVAGMKWFEGLDFVFYAETIDMVPSLVKKALRCENPKTPDFSSYFDRMAEEIANG